MLGLCGGGGVEEKRGGGVLLGVRGVWVILLLWLWMRQETSVSAGGGVKGLCGRGVSGGDEGDIVR